MSDAHPLVTVETVVLVGIGGFAGSNLRYFVGLVLPGLQGTLLVNALGSFALGVLLYEALQVGVLASETKLAASTGFISSFTTYSTFAVETVTSPEWALANVVGSYALGFAGVLAGRTVVHRLMGGER
ncbi:fluoride efflux transporter FluC [Haloarcula salina]|uniref:Fluoride-specific ion channel FluC n=1 Tax=Haloarcula salina TaxID=1429914 RepID=A0AA41KKH6_9EURY|nr:CrcB family protein [Haloarcula salina]MBV0903818.1 CrcB family protein [Haloarcula salina]